MSTRSLSDALERLEHAAFYRGVAEMTQIKVNIAGEEKNIREARAGLTALFDQIQAEKNCYLKALGKLVELVEQSESAPHTEFDAMREDRDLYQEQNARLFDDRRRLKDALTARLDKAERNLREVGGYDNGLLPVPAMGVREILADLRAILDGGRETTEDHDEPWRGRE